MGKPGQSERVRPLKMKKGKLFWAVLLTATLILTASGILSKAGQSGQPAPGIIIFITDSAPVVVQGEPFPVKWIVRCRGELTHTDLHWRQLSDKDMQWVWEQFKEPPKVYVEERELRRKFRFKGGEVFTELQDEYEDAPVLIEEIDRNKLPILQLVIHAVVDGRNYYIFRIFQIL